MTFPLLNFTIRQATEVEKERVKFRNEHEASGNRNQTEESRKRKDRLDKILDLFVDNDVIAMEFNGEGARATSYEEQIKLVDLARRSRGVTLRTRQVESASGVTLFLKRETFNIRK